MDSRFLLSHIRHYPLPQERSLDFARDDDTGIVLSKHIRCTLREINPFPHTVISSAARNLPCTLLFLAPFAKVFPFSLSHIGRYTGMPERSLDFARDDDTEAAFSQQILYTGRGLSIPPYRHFECSREILLALCSFLFLSRKVSPFPLSHIRHYPFLQERSLDFARDDVTGVAFSQHIRCTLREINPFSP